MHDNFSQCVIQLVCTEPIVSGKIIKEHVWSHNETQMWNQMKKREIWIFCYQPRYLPFSVTLEWPLLPLTPPPCRMPPRNDVMYTHLMINMQRWKQGKEERGAEEKQRGERPDGNLLGTVNTAWINLSKRWQHEAWPGNKWAEGTYDGINRAFLECTVYISRTIRSIPDITQVRGILFYGMLMYACVYTCV